MLRLLSSGNPILCLNESNGQNSKKTEEITNPQKVVSFCVFIKSLLQRKEIKDLFSNQNVHLNASLSLSCLSCKSSLIKGIKIFHEFRFTSYNR